MRIGVFDSGIGGITVLKELRRKLPGAEFVYFGDTAHLPYGTKSPSQVRRFCEEGARTLRSKKIDALVVACNTASSLALETFQSVMREVPVFGVVQPGVESVLQAAAGSSEAQTILVLATRATVKSGVYGRTLREAFGGRSVAIFEQACPLLAQMIEEGWVDHPILHQTVAEYVAPYRTQTGIALLGCTHYPWIQKAVEKALPGWTVVNSANAVAAHLERLSEPEVKSASLRPMEWIFTDPDAVPAFALQFIQEEPARV